MACAASRPIASVRLPLAVARFGNWRFVIRRAAPTSVGFRLRARRRVSAGSAIDGAHISGSDARVKPLAAERTRDVLRTSFDDPVPTSDPPGARMSFGRSRMPTADDELVFYTNPQSRGQIVRWMLEEVGAPYRTEVLDYASTMKQPPYLAINPMGKVPAIIHRGVVVTEGAAICAYLADAFPESGLAPAPGHPDRGSYYRWLFFAAGPLEAATSNAAFQFQAPEAAARSLGYGTLQSTLDTLDSAVSGRSHIAGDAFSAADLYLSAYLGFLMRFELVEKRPAFETYVAAHATRPAAVRAREMDAALVEAG